MEIDWAIVFAVLSLIINGFTIFFFIDRDRGWPVMRWFWQTGVGRLIDRDVVI